MQVRDLPRERYVEASVVMADAFIDDPGWGAVGPDDPGRLHSYIRRVCRGVLSVVGWHGGFAWHVERDGRVAGVLAGLDPGQWPPPQLRAMASQSLGPVLGGPTVLWRSLGADSAMHEGHPDDHHVFVWMLAVAPAHQRSGVGRALLTQAIARAEEYQVPTYLDTAKRANLPYYGSFGFEPVGETRLPRGATLWFMSRDVR